MEQTIDMAVQRQTGADAVSQMAMAIAISKGVPLSKSTWEFGEDGTHEYAHRLDLSTEAKSVRIYFSDVDLTKSENVMRKRRTEARLNNAIDQMAVRAHAPTYAFK